MTAAQKRSRNGNMLIVVSVTMGTIGLGLMLGLSFAGIFLAQTILQNFANEVALSAASTMNGGAQTEQANGINSSDRIGQMNNMIVRSRVALHESRQNIDTAVSEGQDQDFLALGQQLYQDAYDGAISMEPERENLKVQVEQDATDQINSKMASIKTYRLVLPWIQMSAPRLALANGITFGQVKEVESNVSELHDSNNLHTDDQGKGFIHHSKRYKANKNMKLQGAEGGVDFNVSSLQAPVKKEVSPARLILPSAFKSLPNGDGAAGDIPSAVKVTLVMDIETRLGVMSKNQIKVVGIATTAGGSEMR